MWTPLWLHWGRVRTSVVSWADGASKVRPTHVRTATRVTENMQPLVARHARVAWAHGPDFFGEEHILEQLRAMLAAHGVDDEAIEAQIARLTVADQARRDTVPFGRADETASLSFGEEPACGDGIVVQVPSVVPAVDLSFPALQDADPEEDEIAEAASALDQAEVKESPKGYIIAVTQRGRLRRLHYAGGCHRKPGEHFLDWVELGDRQPEGHEYNARCLNCFPQGRQEAREMEEQDVSDIGSNSSSDSAQMFEEVAEASGPDGEAPFHIG